jgi:hypothetical protein
MDNVHTKYRDTAYQYSGVALLENYMNYFVLKVRVVTNLSSSAVNIEVK